PGPGVARDHREPRSVVTRVADRSLASFDQGGGQTASAPGTHHEDLLELVVGDGHESVRGAVELTDPAVGDALRSPREELLTAAVPDQGVRHVAAVAVTPR